MSSEIPNFSSSPTNVLCSRCHCENTRGEKLPPDMCVSCCLSAGDDEDAECEPDEYTDLEDEVRVALPSPFPRIPPFSRRTLGCAHSRPRAVWPSSS